MIPYFGNKTYQLLNNLTVQNDIKKFEIDKKFNFVSPATSAWSLKKSFSQMACSDQDSAVTQVAVGGLVHDFHVE